VPGARGVACDAPAHGRSSDNGRDTPRNAQEVPRTRYAITLDTALRLIGERASVAPRHRLVAPTLLRSQVLDALCRAVRRGEIDREEANARPDHMRALKIRLLGDRVLQKKAWDVADRLGWTDTLAAEYVALATLQADALVILDDDLAPAVAGVVPVTPFAALFD